jgi:hypothetical protein
MSSGSGDSAREEHKQPTDTTRILYHNEATQHLHTAPHGTQADAATPQRRGNDELLQEVLQTMREQTLQMREMQQQINALNRSGSRRSIAEALQPVNGEKAGEYSASVSLKRPPVLGRQQRASDTRRQSIGVPSSAFTPGTATTPAPLPTQQTTSAAAVRRMPSLDEGLEDDVAGKDEATEEATTPGTTVIVEEDGLPVYNKRMEQARKAIMLAMKPFHGQAELDKLNVLSWVEKVDTQFSIHMRTRQAGRLDIVRSLLEGAALYWMNRRLDELKDKADRGELSEEIEWHTMRQPFIDQHLGINTIETFKAQLRALKLGSTATPAPVELNQEFDRIAAMAYPDRRSDMRDSVLGDEYSKIIASSNMTIYKSVAYNQNPNHNRPMEVAREPTVGSWEERGGC